MKIALLTATFPLRKGDDPVSLATWELARALRRRGHQILVLTMTEDTTAPKQAEIDGISVASAYWNQTIPLGVFFWQINRARLILEALRDELDRFQPDVIESQEFNGLGFFYAAEKKYPLVIRCHGPMSLLMRQGDSGEFAAADIEMTEAMELATMAAADGLIAVSHDLASKISAASGIPPADFKIIRVPFTVPASVIDRQQTDKNVLPRLLYFGNIHKQKGVDLLIESLPWVAEKYPRIKVHLGGKDWVVPGDSEFYSDKLKVRLAEFGLLNNVEFLGFLKRDQIMKEVRQSDICVFPSKYETACYACLEAVSYGGVTVAAAVGGLPEYHKHGHSAWLVEPRSPKHLADGILHVLSDAQLREHMRSSGRQHVAAVCDPDRIAAESLVVYERAIESYRCSAADALSVRRDLAFRILLQRINGAFADTKIHEYLSKLLYREAERGWHEGRQAGLQEASQANSVGNLAWAAARAAKRLVVRNH